MRQRVLLGRTKYTVTGTRMLQRKLTGENIDLKVHHFVLTYHHLTSMKNGKVTQPVRNSILLVIIFSLIITAQNASFIKYT